MFDIISYIFRGIFSFFNSIFGGSKAKHDWERNTSQNDPTTGQDPRLIEEDFLHSECAANLGRPKNNCEYFIDEALGISGLSTFSSNSNYEKAEQESLIKILAFQRDYTLEKAKSHFDNSESLYIRPGEENVPESLVGNLSPRLCEYLQLPKDSRFKETNPNKQSEKRAKNTLEETNVSRHSIKENGSRNKRRHGENIRTH